MYQFTESGLCCDENGEIVSVEEQAEKLGTLMSEMALREAAFKTEFADKIKMIEALKDSIKKNVLSTGKGLQNENITVTWAKGRTAWDTKKLNELLKKDPGMEEYRTTGDPVVSFKLRTLSN